MPNLKILTNASVSKEILDIFLKDCSKCIASCLGKPESYVCVSCQQNVPMLFGGSDEPAAQLTLMSLGGLSGGVNTKVSSGLAKLMEKHLSVANDHYYIEFYDLKGSFIGYSGATF